MASKGTKQLYPVTTPTRLPLKWTVREQASLLAWSDYCKCKGMSFDSTILGHLRKRWKKNFTKTTIDRKIKHLWKCHGPQGADNKDFDGIRREGTGALYRFHFEDDEVEAIEQERAKLNLPPYPEEWPAADTRESSVQALSQDNLTLEDNCNSINVNGRRLRKRALTHDSSPLPLAKKATTAQRRLSTKQSTLPAFIPDSDEASAWDESSNIPSSQPRMNQEPKKLKKSLLKPREEQQDSDSHNMKTAIEDVSTRYLASERKLCHIFHQFTLLSNRVRDCEQEITSFSDCWESTQKEKEPAAAIQQLKLNIVQLKRERETASKLISLMKYPDQVPSGPSQSFLAEKMGNLEDLCWQMFETESPPKIPIRDSWDTNVECFIRKALNLEDTVPSLRDRLVTLATQIDVKAITQSIAAAAISEWVFESDFPNFDSESSQILQIYRKYLCMQQDGVNVLRSIDVMAHQSLISDEVFKEHTVPFQAEEFTSQLFQILAPFLHPRTHDQWTVDCRYWFEEALLLKAKMILTRERYELVAMTPGTCFDPDTMTTSVPKELATVQLCLFPALFSYSEKQLTRTSGQATKFRDVDTTIVRTRNFVTTERRWRAMHEPITKAIVV